MGSFLDRLMSYAPDVQAGLLVLTAILIAVLGLLAVVVLKRRKRAPSAPVTSVAAASAPPGEPLASPSAAGTPWVRRDPDEAKTLLAFAQDLLGATTTLQLRAAMTGHLPPVLGSRRFWVSTQIRGRKHVIAPEMPEGRSRELLNVSGQEWTTFPLRIDRDVVGLLGIESAGGLRPHLKSFVQSIAPLIAQALNAADQFETLREASLVDLLTGTATRREGITRLDAEIKRAQRTGTSMAVLMLDLDRFKSINDRFGHAVGDAVLTEVGRTLKRTLRASDSRCRWGGEEFLVVLPETDLTRAQIVAGGLLRNIAATTVPGPSGPVACSVSIGLTITRPGETQIEPIVRRADIALYRAKEAGRGCIRVVLGDREGNPIGHRTDDEGPPPPTTPRRATLPFPDRRHPTRRDRRSFPSPGRRSTDPRPQASDRREDVASAVQGLALTS